MPNPETLYLSGLQKARPGIQYPVRAIISNFQKLQSQQDHNETGPQLQQVHINSAQTWLHHGVRKRERKK